MRFAARFALLCSLLATLASASSIQGLRQGKALEPVPECPSSYRTFFACFCDKQKILPRTATNTLPGRQQGLMCLCGDGAAAPTCALDNCQCGGYLPDPSFPDDTKLHGQKCCCKGACRATSPATPAPPKSANNHIDVFANK